MHLEGFFCLLTTVNIWLFFRIVKDYKLKLNFKLIFFFWFDIEMVYHYMRT